MDKVITVGDAASLSSGQTTSFLDSPPSSPSPFFPKNLPLISAFLTFALAEMLDSGGMPWLHSATMLALAVAIGLQEESGNSSFAIAMFLACVVCEFKGVMSCIEVFELSNMY
ncbi:Acid phosphatase/vanadium-dependent haloperoxidase-related protein [Citrus sinensis]|nr:Acid phosphatase/vanadium-dependent haloperoxidase-related protein [Citrus sinensis]